MGKYMKKSKITGDVAVMEVSLSPQCSPGVRTRAKTLALQRQQQQQQQREKQHQKSISSPALGDSDSSFSYLELRSRRLEKPTRFGEAKRQNHGVSQQSSPMAERCCGGNPSPQIPRANSRMRVVESEEEAAVALKGDKAEDFHDAVLEVSFGENNLEFEGKDRSTRESTPCSLIRGSDTLGTPGSTTGQESCTATNQRVRNDMQRIIPTAHEMDEFFAFAEQQQQRIFIEKYNFDIVNDLPLPGRYEWVQVIP